MVDVFFILFSVCLQSILKYKMHVLAKNCARKLQYRFDVAKPKEPVFPKQLSLAKH